MKIRYLLLTLMLIVILPMRAQQPVYGKMSPMVRQLVRQQQLRHPLRKPASAPSSEDTPDYHTCVFLRITEDAPQVMDAHQCRPLAQYGDIYIVDVPLSQVSALSAQHQVQRIEAEPMSEALMDTTRIIVGGRTANEGIGLPQGYTGKGVVIGVEDIGFDLTHPNFYSRDLSTYRISRFWDMLAPSDGSGSVYLGAEFTTRETILQQAHSRDGLDQTHGTHTAGIAAGSGYTSRYQGIAPESELCLVSNAVTEDTVFISKEDFYRFTTATDALGFKYIFDYADQVGKPCVISFSEGSTDMIRSNNILFYEVLERMTGPGRIFVTAAGNSGYLTSYVYKSRQTESAGCFMIGNYQLRHQINAHGPFTLQFDIYADPTSPYIYKATSEQILQQPDSCLTDTLYFGGEPYIIDIIAFRNPYDAFATSYEFSISGPRYFSFKVPFAVQVKGLGSQVEILRMTGEFTTNELNPALHDAVKGHHILAPASAPIAITVGSNAYVTGHYNYLGEWKSSDGGINGQRANMSSIGPTLDGLIKPDVMAPGQNIISSYSSYYLENHPEASDISWDVEHFDFNGRTYPWNSNSGTSMACPVVAGVVALWLQACPTLTPDDVLHIIATTSTHYDATLTYPNNEYGYGQIDAVAGLRYIVATSIREVPATDASHKAPAYNLMGQPVSRAYRGIVIRGGRKYTQ